MDNDLLSRIQDHARLCYPQEACGLLIAVGKKTEVVPCKNIHARPTRFFTIDPLDYAAASDRGQILAAWHSHVDIPPEPSDFDVAACEASELQYIIIGVAKEGDEFTFTGPVFLHPTGYEASYLERPYFFGVYDCYTLVRDFYQREFGIALGDGYPRIDRFWAKGHDLFSENFANEGFIPQIRQTPVYGDLFLIQSSSDLVNHIAIYVGEDTILHHCHGRLSRRDVYAGFWRKHTSRHIRHHSKC